MSNPFRRLTGTKPRPNAGALAAAAAREAFLCQRLAERDTEIITLKDQLDRALTRVATLEWQTGATRSRPPVSGGSDLEAELARLRRQADQDRRNAVELSNRLARAERRPVTTAGFIGGRSA